MSVIGLVFTDTYKRFDKKCILEQEVLEVRQKRKISIEEEVFR